MSQNSIKTILQVDNSDVKEKLKQLDQHYKKTFDGWIDATDKLSKKDKELAEAKKLVANATKQLAEEKQKGTAADKVTIQALNEYIRAKKASISALQAEKTEIKAVANAQKEQISVTRQAIQSMKEMDRVAGAGNLTLEQQWNHFIRMARWGGTLVGVYYAVTRAWGSTLGRGIELNRVIEDNTYGIAALVAANTQAITSTGRLVTMSDKFRMAQGVSAQAMELLRKETTKTFATFPELTEIFQQAIGQTLSMGRSFGNTTDEIIKNTVQLSSRMSNIAGAIGMPMDRVKEEIRSILSGNASTDSLIATMIFGSPSAANEAIRNAKAKGPKAVQELLEGMLKPFDELQDVESFTKSLKNLATAVDGYLMAISKPVKDDLKNAIDGLVSTLSGPGAQVAGKNAEALYEGIKRTVEVVGGGLAAGAIVKYGSALLSLARGFEVATVAIAANTAVSKLNPWVMAATVAGAAGMWLFSGGDEKEKTPKQKASDSQSQSARMAEQQVRSLSEKIKSIESQMKVTEQNADRVLGTVTNQKARENIIAGKESRLRVLQGELTKAQNDIKFYRKAAYVGGRGGAGRLQTSTIDWKQVAEDAKDVSDANDKLVSGLSKQIEKRREIIKTIDREQAALKAAGASPEEVKKYDEARKQELGKISLIQKEIDSLNTKSSSKAEAAANKAAREERTAFELLKQRQEMELAEAGALEALKATNFKLDMSQTSALQKLKLSHFDQTEDSLYKELSAARELKDEKNREFKVNESLEKIYKNQIEKAEYILRVQKGITDENEKQLVSYLRMSGKTFAGMGKTALVGTPTVEEMTASAVGLFGEYEARTKIAKDLGASEDQLNELTQKYTDALDKINTEFGKLPDLEIDLKLNGWDGLSKVIADAGNALTDLADKNKKFDKESQRYSKDSVAYAKLQHKYDIEKLSTYADLTGAVAGFYNEESEQAKKLREVQKALHAAEMIEKLAMMMTEGTLGIASQSKLPFPANIAAMAATGAALASIGVVVGGALSGKGGSTTTSDAISAMADNTGTGSVLGDSASASESIAKSLGLLEDLARPEFRLMGQMTAYLKSIDSKIGGVSALLIRQGGFAFGEGYTGFNTGFKNNVSINSGLMGAINPISIADKFISKIPFLGAVSGFSSGILNSVLGGIFGKKSVSQSLTDSGIFFANALLKNAINSFQGSAYQTIATTVTSKSWFKSSSSTTIQTYFGALDKEVGRQFSLVLKNLYDTTFLAGKALDTSAESIDSSLANFVVKVGKISLAGKSGTQIQETLAAVFGKIGDDIAKTVFPALTPFQKVGEGMFETMTRVSSAMEEAGYYINRLGSAFQDVTYKQIVNKQGDVAFEALSQSIRRLDEATYGANNGVIQMLGILTGSAKELYETYTIFTKLRDRIVLTGQDAKYLTSQMVMGAGGVQELSDASDSFFTNFFSEAEQFAANQKALTVEFGKLGLALPASKQAFRDLVSSIDISTEAGQELYGRVLLLSEGFSTLSDSQDNVYQGVRDLANAFRGLGDSITQTIEQLTGISTGDTTRAQIDAFWAKKSELDTLLAKNGDLTPTEQSRLSSLITGLNQLSLSLGQADASLAGGLIDTLGNIRSELKVDELTLLGAIGGATSLQEVGVLTALKGLLPSYDVGTPYVPNDQIAMIHQGEMVIDPQSSAALRKYGIGGLNILGGGSQELLGGIYARLEEMAGYMQRMDRNIDSVTRGNALNVRSA